VNQKRPIVIVGAGPAGMSAAITLAELGLQSTVIDENSDTGGQIYRQPPTTFETSRNSESTMKPDRGAQLRGRFRELSGKIEISFNAKVWGVFGKRRLAVTSKTGWSLIDSDRLLLAPGAYEFVPPFQGWTLPGVMTPGAAQLMVKSMRILPGRRALVVGTGPFLLVVAECLHNAGVEVVGVVETIRRTEVVRAFPGLLHDFSLMRQGWQYLQNLKKAGIPIHTGHVVVEAEGKERVEQVKFAPCDSEWRPDPSRMKIANVDTLCVGYGFVSRTELAQLSGCEMEWRDESGGWLPKVDENLMTSAEGVWVAGDGGSVAGALVAEDEGVLAGLAIARNCGALDDESFQRRRGPVMGRLNRLRRFRRTLDNLSRIRSGLSDLPQENTLICRCEELVRSDVEAAVAAGCTTNRTIKVATRLGMGRCQGRMCWPAMARFVALKTGKTVKDVGPLSVRPPIVPVTMGELADVESTATIADGDGSP
jgi:hydrogen cyanide synthase HcnB